jgi:two-component system sensor histidine kinase MtrB
VLRSHHEKIATQSLPHETPLRHDVPADLAVVADELAIDRIVSNLLINALRHGAPPIEVAAEQRDGHLCISVTDHGRGVPEELRPRLFERFERGAEADGSGLGLAIARAYAQAHGGDLLYERNEDGPRFELVLPHSAA